MGFRRESEYLWATHGALRDLIGPDPSSPSGPRPAGASISPLRLYLSVCNANFQNGTVPGRFATSAVSASKFWTPPASSVTTVDDVLVLVATPFAFVLTSCVGQPFGLDITDWATWDLGRKPSNGEAALLVPTTDSIHGFIRAMVYPGEY
jgi:hypothetical protein